MLFKSPKFAIDFEEFLSIKKKYYIFFKNKVTLRSMLWFRMKGKLLY